MIPVRSAQLPELDARRNRAVRYLEASAPAIACPHLAATVAEGGRGVICAEHPAAGILCPDCAHAHTRRHPHDVEHLCDVCSTQAATLHSFIGTANVALATLTTAGRFAAYIGPVLVVALGACTPCATAAGLGLEVVG